MADSFYFYDLETSGVNPREARIMQFAGQRTDLDLNPIGEPHNILIKLTDDILPEPDAILITGITPQQTQLEGITEREFLGIFSKEIATAGTIFVGFNTVRFDDEFMRYLHWRNFYDAYEWQWKDGRSRWDLLDVVRMTRALRPEGIKWPVDSNGKATNRLELLTSINGLDHAHAHDALSDVQASIALARLLREKQPKLFDYLLAMRNKDNIRALVNSGKPFVYSSGKYPSEYEKTTVAIKIADHPKQGGALVYDLRHDPKRFADMSAADLVEAWKWRPKSDNEAPRLPIKMIKYNRCPAIAPFSVLDEDSQQRLGIDLQAVEQNRQKLEKVTVWPDRVFEALEMLDKQQQAQFFASPHEVDGQLYDKFCSDADKRIMRDIRRSGADTMQFAEKFSDERLIELLPLYKARNFPGYLDDEERQAWEDYKKQRLYDGGSQSRLAKFFKRLEELSTQSKLSQKQRYLLEDLALYGQSLMPSD